ncbi:kinesin-like protein Klp8 [Apophysomyces sp. BC1034]|nr:kinesin-like protein Klp8 [Apophysomyces sp. BC1034]
MEGNQTILTRPACEKTHKEEEIKAFTFDKSYWSVDKEDGSYASQETVYQDLGRELLDHAFDGYNCCIFAYGQTGSGKSYSMMGYGADKGIIPRTCSDLFDRISHETTDTLNFQVEVTYIEIYNEKVRDLLNPKNKSTLRVREHPTLGPYVEDLSRLAVGSFNDIHYLMNEGNKARTVAATNMNATSSRSHAVFTLFLTSKRLDEQTELATEKVARISLVDLAGSERADSTGATGVRLKEGANINKSLTTLGKVIASLAEHSSQEHHSGRKLKDTHIPYRDSVLTWLLKDSLGGNSKTAMIAAISPADYDETLSTLRYADQAKKIKNEAVVNEDPNAKLIRELKEELAVLRETLMVYAPEEVEKIASHTGHKGTNSTDHKEVLPSSQKITFTDAAGNTKYLTKEEVVDQLETSEKLLNDLNQTWKEKLSKAHDIHLERENALEELGIMVDKNNMGIYTPKKAPHLVNLNEDPLMTECLMYQIKPGITRVGKLESGVPADIRLSGPNIYDEHCFFENTGSRITIHPGKDDAMVMVNGRRILQPKSLRSGFRIILGDFHVFRFNHPEEVRKERSHQRAAMDGSSIAGDTDDSRSRVESLDISSSERDGAKTPDLVDWSYAKREAALHHYNLEPACGSLTDNDISDLRQSRKSLSTNSPGTEDDSLSHTSSLRIDTVWNTPDLTVDSADEVRIGINPLDQEMLLKQMREDMQQQLELQKQEYEERIRLIEAANGKCEDISIKEDEVDDKLRLAEKRMEQMLNQQKKAYESKIKHISQQLPPGAALNSPLFSPLYKETEVELVRRVTEKWKSLRYVTMAETTLTNAVVLKEVNVISKELGKDVFYQFTIVHEGASATALSFWEPHSAAKSYEKLHDELQIEKNSCVGVLVIDRKHQVTYIWSLDNLKTRLQRMRSLYNFTEQPLYLTHPSLEDPFYQNPPPRFSLIGVAAIPLQNLAFQVPIESTVDIYCRNTCEVMGKLKVLVAPIARSVAQEMGISDDGPVISPLHGTSKVVPSSQCFLHIGQQQVFEIRILSLVGIEEKCFTQIHAQFRLSAFGNVKQYSSADKLFATDPISDFGSSPIQFAYCQTLSSTITADMLNVVMNKDLSIEVYGRVQLEHLDRLVGVHIEREVLESPSVVLADEPFDFDMETEDSAVSTRQVLDHRLKRQITLDYHPDDGMLQEERHDVVAWVQICELTEEGEYSPVEVVSQNTSDSGVFSLRQGLQRRIMLRLMHDSGKKLLWQSISHMTVGNVRLMDGKGRITEPPAHTNVAVQLFSEQQLEFYHPGTSVLSAQGPWDSSLHDSLFLNRVTASNQCILLALEWEVQCEKRIRPIKFHMDIPVQIHSRDSSSGVSMFRNFLSSQRILSKVSGIFIVHLKPPMTRRLRDLWRLNTSHMYVRGEEFLGSWRPRGVSLVNDYRKYRQKMISGENVSKTKHKLIVADLRRERASQQVSNDESTREPVDDQQLVQKILRLWTSKHGTDKEIVISQLPPSITDPSTLLVSNDSPFDHPNIKLTPDAQQMIPSDTVTKKGYLTHTVDVDDSWIKRWFVLRRPFIIIYEDQSETNELGVMNLMSVRVDYKKDLEFMLKRPNIFAIYTSNNVYLLQAPDYDEMMDWITKVDQFYTPALSQQP